MEKVTDNFGSMICMADTATGLVEERYRDLTMRVAIQIGDSFTLSRGNKVTVVTRTPEGFAAVSVMAA